MNLKTTTTTMSLKLMVFPWTTTAKSNSNKCVSLILLISKLCSELRLFTITKYISLATIHVKFVVTNVLDPANGISGHVAESANIKSKY